MSKDWHDGYIAGIFDGEGCVTAGISAQNTTWLSVGVSMCDREAVDMLYKRFGGLYRAAHRTSSDRLIYTWTIMNGKAIKTLEFLSDNCVIKKEVSEIGLSLAKRMDAHWAGITLTLEEKEERVALIRRIRAKINRKPLNESRISDFLRKKSNGDTPVINENGVWFPSQREAAKSVNRTQSAIWIAVNKGTPCAGINWRYAS